MFGNAFSLIGFGLFWLLVNLLLAAMITGQMAQFYAKSYKRGDKPAKRTWLAISVLAFLMQISAQVVAQVQVDLAVPMWLIVLNTVVAVIVHIAVWVMTAFITGIVDVQDDYLYMP